MKTLPPTTCDLTLVTDPVESAETAGLRYVTDDSPGICRQHRGKGFIYIGVDGKRLTNQSEIKRIESLVIPPAWKDVWICPIANGHLQATGRDAKGRKQYRYHHHWRTVRSQTKFNRMIPFSAAIPLIREQIDRDLSLKGLPREKVLATAVQLLETTHIRIGNVEYAQENKTFGLTTLRNRHVEVSNTTIHFHFKGKSGVNHDIELRDRRLARIIKRCQDIPGYELFQYLDNEGQCRAINSEDVNNYLREITGEDFTAKDFRTWAGTVLAAQELKQMPACESQTQMKKNVTQAIKAVAKELGNKPATCRKYYVHPAIIDAYLEGTLGEMIEEYSDSTSDDAPYSLSSQERAVVLILERSLTDLEK